MWSTMLRQGGIRLGQGLACLILWQTALRLWRKLRPGSRPAWLDWEPVSLLRRLMWPAETLVGRLGIQPGMHVVEVRAGTSQLTAALAQAVGPTGQVLAVDDRPGSVEHLQIKFLEMGLTQVIVEQAEASALPALAAGCDLIVLTLVFGGAAEKQAIINEAYKMLRPGGAVAITELLVDPDYSLASTVGTHLILLMFGIDRFS
jgi:ubiquinone/menaquinone biosynthesis C-methylase UbiE